jgi:type IV secretory pathway VirD2 relaxase
MGRPKSTKNFLAYLTRDGVGEEGGRGRLFDAYDHEPSTQVFIEESWRDPHQYLWLFSPEDGNALDLRAFGREVMAQASKVIGHPLVYLSAAHYNTQAPHVHTVIGIPGSSLSYFLGQVTRSSLRLSAEPGTCTWG